MRKDSRVPIRVNEAAYKVLEKEKIFLNARSFSQVILKLYEEARGETEISETEQLLRALRRVHELIAVGAKQ